MTVTSWISGVFAIFCEKSVVYYRAKQRTFWPEPSEFFPIKVSKFFPRKTHFEKIYYILGNFTLFSQGSKSKKKSTSRKFLIFRKMELPSFNIKKLNIFSQKKAFHIFQQIEFSNPNNKRVQERTSEPEK